MFDKLTQWFIQKLNEYQKRNPVEWCALGITTDNQWSENPIKIKGKNHAFRIYTVNKRECIFQLLDNKLIHVKSRHAVYDLQNTLWTGFEYQSFENGEFYFQSEVSIATIEVLPIVTRMCEDVFGFEFNRWVAKDGTTSQMSLSFKVES